MEMMKPVNGGDTYGSIVENMYKLPPYVPYEAIKPGFSKVLA